MDSCKPYRISMPPSAKRTTSTSASFVKLKDLPFGLREATKCHKKIALIDGCDTQDGAAGLCLEESGEFIETLREFRKQFKEIPRAYFREYIFHPLNDIEERRQKRDRQLRHFPFDSSGCRFHFVVKTGGFIIDWTARQFGERNPFPAIWREL